MAGRKVAPGQRAKVREGGMKARIWKDRESGRWCWDLEGHGLRSTGDRADWQAALDEALDDLRWIEAHRMAWRT